MLVGNKVDMKLEYLCIELVAKLASRRDLTALNRMDSFSLSARPRPIPTSMKFLIGSVRKY